MALDPDMDADLQALQVAAETFQTGTLSPVAQQFVSPAALATWLATHLHDGGESPLLHWVQQRTGPQVLPVAWLGVGAGAKRRSEALAFVLARVPYLIQMTRMMVDQVAAETKRREAAEREMHVLKASLRLMTQRVQALTAQHGGAVEEYFQAVVQIAVKNLGAESPDELRTTRAMLETEDWRLFEENREITRLLNQPSPPPAPAYKTNARTLDRQHLDPRPPRLGLGDDPIMAGPVYHLTPARDEDAQITIEEIQTFTPPQAGMAFRAVVQFMSPDGSQPQRGELDLSHNGERLLRMIGSGISQTMWMNALREVRAHLSKLLQERHL